ncbi:uncharacterized protein N7498_009893 [Penicillium cinerascens]|uniref:Uncharacterized protein n=1 Tax=Penicillium cinerascens TaxID=70096 RepID=A0A9W9J6D9_9EURO|nr:uncharacterized protein N7498_009893 [Penicillium cinerascens]KAJ5190908.1 hypothetical protein N7498_009893 [Penicillium cinerascens]
MIPANNKPSHSMGCRARLDQTSYVMWIFGDIDAETWDDAAVNDMVNELPSNHSPYFAPAIQPTLRTGVDALALGALTFLKRK